MPDTMSKKSIIALMLAVIGMLLLVASFILPWWGTHTVNEDVDLDDGDKDYYEYGGGISITSGTGFYSGGSSLYSGDYSVPALFGVTAMLMIMALIFTSLLITSILLYEMEKIRKFKFAKIFGILALIFCILAPIIFMAAFPGALKADEEKRAEQDDREYEAPDHDDPTKSFFGDYKDVDEDDYYKETTTQSWGGDIGWFLAFVSFGFILISFIMAIPRKAMSSQKTIKRYPVQSPSPQQEFASTYPQQEQYPPSQPPP